MKKLVTTLGHYRAEDLDIILPHEHIFVDLGPIEEENWKTAWAHPVVKRMAPELEKIKKAGVSAFVDCTPVGVGRRADIVRAVSLAAQVPVVVPTGIYREPWVPGWAREATLEDIRDWMISELTDEIEDSGVRAGWIKLSAGDDGLTDVDTKILRAAAQAGKATGALIGSHTIRGRVVMDQLQIIIKEGYSPQRFLWIHTQAEPAEEQHLEAARMGAWLEFDAIGSEQFHDEYFLENIGRLVEAGFERQLLLSQDRGWYDPSQPGGGEVKPYTYLLEEFVPAMRQYGFSEPLIFQLISSNPRRAFQR